MQSAYSFIDADTWCATCSTGFLGVECQTCGFQVPTAADQTAPGGTGVHSTAVGNSKAPAAAAAAVASKTNGACSPPSPFAPGVNSTAVGNSNAPAAAGGSGTGVQGCRNGLRNGVLGITIRAVATAAADHDGITSGYLEVR